MSSSQKAYSKLKWTSEEQQLLRSLKQQKHIDSWKTIANEMNQIFQQKNRSGKQCRERYMNYVRFGNGAPKISGWTPQEDHQLFLKFMDHGAKWVQIGKQMEGRSQNCLKNRFYGAMRKIIRKINRAAKEKKLRQKKPIKTDLLIRILESPCYLNKGDLREPIQAFQFLDELKKQMIKIAINPQQNSSLDQIECLINGISKFCSTTKTLAQKKTLMKQKQENHEQSCGQEVSQNFHEQNQDNAESVQMNQQIRKDDEDRTLTDKVPQKQAHKIVKNLILFSSQDLNQNKPNLASSITLFTNKIVQIPSSRNQDDNEID